MQNDCMITCYYEQNDPTCHFSASRQGPPEIPLLDYYTDHCRQVQVHHCARGRFIVILFIRFISNSMVDHFDKDSKSFLNSINALIFVPVA